ncbi:MAG: hypothetical protein ACXWZ8_07155 [Gaiellaceae bacterium]
MGGRFWVGMVLAVVGIGIATAVVFAIIGAAAIAWGGLGAIALFGLLLLGAGWIYDRRKQAEYARYE